MRRDHQLFTRDAARSLAVVLALAASLQAAGAASAQGQAPSDQQRQASASREQNPGSQQAKPAEDQQAQLGQDAVSFMKEAIVGGMTEVQLGQLAKTRAQNPMVKIFGERLVQDHTAANKKLRAIAQKNNVQLPEELDSKHAQTVQEFEQKPVDQFDQPFMILAVKDHAADIREFQNKLDQVHDPELRAFIKDVIPTLRDHLQMARNAALAVGLSQDAIAAASQASESEKPKNESVGGAPGGQQGQQQGADQEDSQPQGK